MSIRGGTSSSIWKVDEGVVEVDMMDKGVFVAEEYDEFMAGDGGDDDPATVSGSGPGNGVQTERLLEVVDCMRRRTHAMRFVVDKIEEKSRNPRRQRQRSVSVELNKASRAKYVRRKEKLASERKERRVKKVFGWQGQAARVQEI